MKKVILTMMATGMVLTSCENKSNEEVVTDMNNDAVVMENDTQGEAMEDNKAWVGVYEGTLPCADCEGIETVVTLNEDGTYAKEQEYVGKEENNKFSEMGTFVWNDDNTVLTLTSNDDAAVKSMYKVEEGKITALDEDGNMVEGELSEHYVLNKK